MIINRMYENQTLLSL